MPFVVVKCWNKIVLAWNNFRLWFHVATKILQPLKLFQRPRWNNFRAIECVGNYANVTCWVRMARHVIVNLLCPFPENFLFHFKMKSPAQIKLFHCKTISHWNILFHAKIILIQHGTTTLAWSKFSVEYSFLFQMVEKLVFSESTKKHDKYSWKESCTFFMDQAVHCTTVSQDHTRWLSAVHWPLQLSIIADTHWSTWPDYTMQHTITR